MVSLFNNSIRPIGIDIGHKSVKMIQLVCGKDKVKIAAAEEITLDYSGSSSTDYYNAVVDAVKKTISKGKFKGRNVISCLSNDQMKIKSLRLDMKDSKDIDNILENEIKNKFGIDRNCHHIDYLSAGSIRQGDDVKNELILFTAHNDAIKEHINILERCGLNPVGIDSVPCALFRCFTRIFRRQEDGDTINVFVDLGSCYTTLVITKGWEIAFIKQIPIGGRDLNKAVADKLDISIDEALLMRAKLQNQDDQMMEPATKQGILDAMTDMVETLTREIMLCFKYFTVTFRGKKPQHAIFAGGEACEQMLIDSLNKNLAVNIEIGRPLRGIEVNGTMFSEERRKTNCQWAVAIGLGLKGVDTIESLN